MHSVPYSLAAASLAAACLCGRGTTASQAGSQSQFPQGLPTDPSFFPIGVWLQAPERAAEYRAIGVNLYVGLWRGPTEEQLAELGQHDMKVICAQNEVGLRHLDNPTIFAWMHGDEPDNAQSMERHWRNDAAAANAAWPGIEPKTLQEWGTWGPPIPPDEIVADYQRLRRRDPSRPVFLNLGQGVAWDSWHGRGIRTNHPEDYPEYIAGCDIVSYDIYPVNSSHADVQDQLWRVPFGVQRLRRWSNDEKTVWNVIECTQYGGHGRRPTPEEVRAQAWMSLVAGSRGLIYFVHEFAVKDSAGTEIRPFTEAGLLRDQDMARAVGALNHQIHALAPVLNTPTVTDAASIQTAGDTDRIDAMVKRLDGITYLFAVNTRPDSAQATFRLRDVHADRAALIDDQRELPVDNGTFTDVFGAYAVHLYRIAPQE